MDSKPFSRMATTEPSPLAIHTSHVSATASTSAVMTESPTATQPAPTFGVNADIRSSTAGFSALLNDDVDTARDVFRSRPDSVFHNMGAALISFLEACLGQEEKDLSSSLDLLFKAEEAVKKAKHRAVTAADASTSPRWWPAGTEYDCLAAETLICQALVHFLTESLVEMTKGIYKLGRAHKQFAAAYKHVFPSMALQTATGPGEAAPSSQAKRVQDVTGDPQHLVNTINLLYASAALQQQSPRHHNPTHHNTTGHPPAAATPSSWIFGSGLRERLGGYSPARTYSNSQIAPATGKSRSRPTSGVMTAPTSAPATPEGHISKTAWQNDDLTLLVVGATAFGNAVFGLILSVLPSKARKLLGWVGFSGVLDRRESVRMLSLAATRCSAETHGLLSGLALLSYFFVVIMANNWQADENFIFGSYDSLVTHFSELLPDSSVCALHRSRLYRIRRDAKRARETLVAWQHHRPGHEPGSGASSASAVEGRKARGDKLGMRQLDSLMWHEISHLNVTLALWQEAADAFLECQARSSWSHVTTTFAAVGCLMLVPDRTPELDKHIGDMFAELPKLFKQRRLFGEPPPMETYISRKLVLYKAKHEQLCALGVVPESRQACFWDSIAVSPIEEFGLLWSMYGKTPPDTLEANVNRLAALTPVIDLEAAARPSPPASLSSASTGSSSTRHPNGIPHRATSLTEGATAGKTRLFLVDELAVRDVVVGIQLSSLGRFVAARSILRRVVEGESAVHSDTFIVAHALAEMAVIELREGEEVAGRMKDKDEAELAKLWKDRTAEASRWIEAAFARGAEHYNMRSRLEFKLGLLREEISDRKTLLGIA